MARATELPDTEIVHLLTFGEAPYARSDLARYFRINSFFIAENVRGMIQEGLGDYTPIFLSDIPRLFSSGQLPLDVALVQVTPPDGRGCAAWACRWISSSSAAENAGLVIAQVNPQMPRTLGDSFLHVHDLDMLVPVDVPHHRNSPRRARRNAPAASANTSPPLSTTARRWSSASGEFPRRWSSF